MLEQHVLHTGHRADCPSVRARRDPALPCSTAACAAGTLLRSPPDFEGQRHRVLLYHSALAVRVGGQVESQVCGAAVKGICLAGAKELQEMRRALGWWGCL